MSERKSLLLRLDPAVHDALARWASDELRSTNAQIEFLLRRALADAGRLPSRAGEMRGPAARPAPSRPADRRGGQGSLIQTDRCAGSSAACTAAVSSSRTVPSSTASCRRAANAPRI